MCTLFARGLVDGTAKNYQQIRYVYGIVLAYRHDGRHVITDFKAIKAAKKNPPKVALSAAQASEEHACAEQRWKDIARADARKRRHGMRWTRI